MKTRAFVSIILTFILSMGLLGCQLSTTLTVEAEDYDVRIINKSGNTAKIRWDSGSTRYLDDGEIIYISTESGNYELEWEDAHSRSNTRPTSTKHVFKVSVEADIDIVFEDEHDEPNVKVIVVEK
jgi:hypothetical protein